MVTETHELVWLRNESAVKRAVRVKRMAMAEAELLRTPHCLLTVPDNPIG